MFDVKKMGKRIKELRGKASQDECAIKLGISRGALSFYENGERKPDADVIYKMCEYFNVSSDYLLGLTDNMTTDIEIQAICDYTGLSEVALDMIRKKTHCPSKVHLKYDGKYYDLSENTVKYYDVTKKILNQVITNKCFWNILSYWLAMKKLEDTQQSKNDNIKNDNNVADLVDFIVQDCNSIDVARYKITKLVEKLSDMFDIRITHKN